MALKRYYWDIQSDVLAYLPLTQMFPLVKIFVESQRLFAWELAVLALAFPRFPA